MNFLGIKGMHIPFTTREETSSEVKKDIINTQPVNAIFGDWNSRYRGSYAISFDGEKNLGEIGAVINYVLDHDGLRYRSWKAYLDNEIARIVINKYIIWIVDKGLKLQCAPNKEILKEYGYGDVDVEKFNRILEARFTIWSKSKRSSHNGMNSFNKLSKNAFKTAKVGGDCLVILRYVNKQITVQLIDGKHLQTPLGGVSEEGNKIYNGIEVDSTGRHIKYHIKNGIETSSVDAWDKTSGLRVAYLVYGSEYRLDDCRGLPVISTSLETLAKIDRYKEAAVGSAEERQKIPFTIEHDESSDGENPFIDQLVSALDTSLDGSANGNLPMDSQGESLANRIAATTNKSVYNMGKGAHLKALDSKGELFFKEFYETNAHIICASVGIPPNVAFSIYNDSFSASRAATKDWEHTIDFERNDWQEQFYSPVLAFFLHVNILEGKISAPGYLQAFYDNDFVLVDAYLNCRFTGAMFPHIDPLKEVNAERAKLGDLGKNLPLTTLEQATESLMSGDSSSNLEQFSNELAVADNYGIEKSTPKEPASGKPVKEEVIKED